MHADVRDAAIGRIRPDASVDCTDGHLGRVDSLERAADGRPTSLRVVPEWTDQPLVLPLGLIRSVGQDGSVELTCARSEIERLAAEAPAHGLPVDDDETVRRLEDVDAEHTLELREEELIPRKAMREVGEVRLHKEVEEVPRRLEVEASREEVVVEHVPVGRVVGEREGPREDGDVLVVPVYEEQLVVVKRLVLREELRIRRERVAEKQIFEDTVLRERVVIDDSDLSDRVRERYHTDETEEQQRPDGGLLGKLGRKLLE